jgi:RNA polymerase sigma-70 factor (family 1)
MPATADKILYLQHQIALHGDQAAYKDLYLIFYRPLLQFAYSFVRSHETAEEIVSDVFVNIWKKRKELAGIQNLKLYLFVSAKNTALNYLRAQKKPLLQAEQYQVQLQSIYFDPERLMITAEMVNRVQAAIRKLPPRCQLIFKLVKEDGLKYREVAELLNLSVKTVENQMATAIQRLGEAMAFDMLSTLSSGHK